MFNIFKKSKPIGEEVTYKIDGMHCTSCSLNIDGALEDVEGVIESNTSYAKSHASIRFDPKIVSKQKIKEVIVATGYKILN